MVQLPLGAYFLAGSAFFSAAGAAAAAAGVSAAFFTAFTVITTSLGLSNKVTPGSLMS